MITDLHSPSYWRVMCFYFDLNTTCNTLHHGRSACNNTYTGVHAVALSIGMAYDTSSVEDSSDNDSDVSHARTATGHKKRPDDDSNLGRTCTATEHRKHSSSQTAAQREEGLAAG